ncbi:unnamed protein product [Miscanthus lutarioriparius]|uniref:NB-ARC domain-containing protein n=1 Tax=Miscanthus lutarioriparius TaxID=422564 RepID=A0A811Q173_9POAL|nr:unnamed protein product [Miscanthus lutarioriparius]
MGVDAAELSRLKRAMKKMGKVFGKAKARRNIAGAIEDIKKHLEEVAERRQKYKLDDIMCKPLATTSTIDPRLKAMQLIGVDKSRDELVSMLMTLQPDDGTSNQEMRSLSHISMDILFHLDGEKHKDIHNTRRGLELLIHQLREFLKKKRRSNFTNQWFFHFGVDMYFIVFDDVWEVRTWEAIEPALVENNLGSKVITTTRNFDVAKASGKVYKLKPLSYDDSMKLFYTRLSGADRKFHEISEKILKKCAGIPLAIITMTSLLAGKPECDWSMVYNSIGLDTGGNTEAEDTMTILSFSYYDLPPDLRTCLLYLSTYPEEYEIKKDSLIWKWIAEGFINPDRGKTLFELGERYFNDLINRSLLIKVIILKQRLDEAATFPGMGAATWPLQAHAGLVGRQRPWSHRSGRGHYMLARDAGTVPSAMSQARVGPRLDQSVYG